MSGETELARERAGGGVPGELTACAPALPPKLCDFIDWVADYTLNPPGAILAMALRSRGAFEPESLRVAYVRGSTTPPANC